jgi:PAS domain S-box-containing protein
MAGETNPDEQLGFDLYELLPDVILVVDRRGIIRYANCEARRVFGQEKGTLVSVPVEALVPEHLRERHLCHRNKYVLEPKTRQMGVGLDPVARRADGTTFPVDIVLKPLTHLSEPMVLAVVRDITDQRAAEEIKQLMAREVNHRAKNLLSVVEAIAHRTAESPEGFTERFSERIQALAANQDLLIRNEWQGVEIEELVRAQLAHFADLLGSRIALRGPALRMKPASAQTVGLALHELATNAAKYGALSTDAGRVDIRWGSDGDNFTMGWTESEGPSVSAPQRRGFGSVIMEGMVEHTVDGRVDRDYAPSGFTWRLTCPAPKALELGERERAE